MSLLAEGIFLLLLFHLTQGESLKTQAMTRHEKVFPGLCMSIPSLKKKKKKLYQRA